ncbi:hypothetical protein FXO38_11061 [Capsicum annuum]|nr:hypothetical protein FXO38_11061 [Capsicum annuum]KAF3682713.1 hypothetical protein FXO37_02209 [Capsicum annuum]
MDDDSFRARVHKVFGSLSSSSSPPSPSASVWYLTDEDVEKKEWNRSALKQGKDDDDHNLCSSSYDGLFKQKRRNMTQGLESVIEDLNDDGSDLNDVWEIRSSIGLDSTLDNEFPNLYQYRSLKEHPFPQGLKEGNLSSNSEVYSHVACAASIPVHCTKTCSTALLPFLSNLLSNTISGVVQYGLERCMTRG